MLLILCYDVRDRYDQHDFDSKIFDSMIVINDDDAMIVIDGGDGIDDGMGEGGE